MAQAKPKTCPVCSKPVDIKTYPFCSERCAQIDLGRWLNEAYVIAEPAQDEPQNDPRMN